MSDIQRPESSQPIPRHARKAHKGVIFDVYQWEQEMFDGSHETFERLKRPDTAVVFPILDNGNVLLTRQEQPGKSPFIGGAGGRVDEGEEVLDAAKREMLEESGYEADELILWKTLQPVGKIDWVVFVFVAHGCRKVADLSPDAGEKIEPFEVSFDEFLTIASGEGAERFSEVEIVPDILQARLHPEKMEKLKKLFRVQ